MLQELIVIEADVNSWEEAIRTTSQELLKKGFVKESFFQACVDREKVFPTGLPTRIPVAIPHTDPGHVIVPSLCLLRLQRPVSFVSMEDGGESVKVEFVFNMALQQAENQVPMIQTIIETVQDSCFLKELKALDLEQIYKKLSTKWQNDGALQKKEKTMNVFVRKPTDLQIERMQTNPVWEHEAGSFPWEYKEKRETCLIISGKAYVEGENGEQYSFEQGDLVTFPTYWKCTWTILKDIKKHYVFGNFV